MKKNAEHLHCCAKKVVESFTVPMRDKPTNGASCKTHRKCNMIFLHAEYNYQRFQKYIEVVHKSMNNNKTVRV